MKALIIQICIGQSRLTQLIVGVLFLLCHLVSAQNSKMKDSGSKGFDNIAKSNEMIMKNQIYSEDFYETVIMSGKCRATEEDKVRYLVNFGIALLAKGCYTSSLDKFEKAREYVQKNGLNYDTELIEFNIAIVRLGLRRYDEALNHLNQLPEVKFANFGYYYYRGMAEMGQNRFDEAVESFEKDLKTQLNSNRTHYALASLYAKRNNWNKALEHIQQTDISYNNVDELVLFGNVYLFAQSNTEASKYFKKIEDKQDEFTNCKKSHEKKISILGNSIPSSFFSYHLVRSVMLAAGGDERAVKDLKKDKAALSHYCALFTIANDYFKGGNFREAEVFFKKAIDKNKNDALAYLGLGTAQLKQDKYIDATIQFSKAISLNGDLLPAYEARLLTYYILQRYDECLADYETLLQKDPTYSLGYDALVCIGFYKFSYQLPEEAKALFEQAISRFPDECGGYAGLGIYLMQFEKDVPKALEQFNKAISKDRSESLGYVNRANSLYTLAHDVRYSDINKRKRQRYALRSSRDFDRAIELDPTNAAAYNGKAMVVLKELMAQAIQKKGKNQDVPRWALEFAKVDSLVQMAVHANRMDKRSTDRVKSQTEKSILMNHAFMVGQMAGILAKLNNLEVAKLLLDKSKEITLEGIRLFPSDSTSYWLNYAVSCASIGDYNEAVLFVKRAMDNKNLCSAQNNISFYYYQIEMRDSSELMLQNAAGCMVNWPDSYRELIKNNYAFITNNSGKNDVFIQLYAYEPIVDWRPANLRFNLTIPAYRFEPNVLLILQNMAIDNRSDGPCVVKDASKEKPLRLKDFKPDDDTVPPCPGSNKNKRKKS